MRSSTTSVVISPKHRINGAKAAKQIYVGAIEVDILIGNKCRMNGHRNVVWVF